MYNGVVANINTYNGLTSDFLITIGLYQESGLNICVFAIVINVLTIAI